jgi:hypothetical protein
MEPPITRMASVSAVTVAIKSSGQIIVVIIEAGTTMPPIPSPATTRIPQSLYRLKRSAQARAPQPRNFSTALDIVKELKWTYQRS